MALNDHLYGYCYDLCNLCRLVLTYVFLLYIFSFLFSSSYKQTANVLWLLRKSSHQIGSYSPFNLLHQLDLSRFVSLFHYCSGFCFRFFFISLFLPIQQLMLLIKSKASDDEKK